MASSKLIATIYQEAKANSLKPELLAAVIIQESNGDPTAIRWEPDFFQKYIANKTLKELGGHYSASCTQETERMLRSCSIGIMQIMGQVAREKGFKSPFLTTLLDPGTNIKLGASILAGHLRTRGSVEAALLRWNGGANREYPKQVLSHIETGAIRNVLV